MTLSFQVSHRVLQNVSATSAQDKAKIRLDEAEAAKKEWTEKTRKKYLDQIKSIVRSFQEPLLWIEEGEDATQNLKSIISKLEKVFGEMKDKEKDIERELNDAQDDVDFLGHK